MTDTIESLVYSLVYIAINGHVDDLFEHTRDHLTRARALGPEWRTDMENAPKDGTKVDLWIKLTEPEEQYRVVNGWWGEETDYMTGDIIKGSYCWNYEERDTWGDFTVWKAEGVTHWAQTPQPPQEPGQ